MNDRLKKWIIAAWRSRDGADEINSPPASEKSLREFEEEFGPIPDKFHWFLENCGGGVVGAEWIDDIEALKTTHRRFKSERDAGYWPLMNQVFVIGRDGAGNFFGIHEPSGKLVVEDHDFGGLHEMAESFATILTRDLGLEITDSI